MAGVMSLRTLPRPIASLILVAGVAGACTTNAPPPAPSAAACPPPRDLPGLATGSAPWPAELDGLEARLKAIGAPILQREGQVVDRHVMVSVFVDGRQVRVPTSIGLNGEEVAGGMMASGFVTEMHTHDSSGVVHVHAEGERPFLLGEFFDVWGVALEHGRLGGYCATGDKAVRVFVDGTPATGDPRSVELADGRRITVTFGSDPEAPAPAG